MEVCNAPKVLHWHCSMSSNILTFTGEIRLQVCMHSRFACLHVGTQMLVDGCVG